MKNGWLRRDGPPLEGCSWWTKDRIRVAVGQEEGRWHLSISTAENTYPTWDEIADARYSLLPAGLDFAMILPPAIDYVNLRNVFHLWEIRDPGLPIGRGAAMPRTLESGAHP